MRLFAVWALRGLDVEVRAKNAYEAVVKSGVKNPLVVACIDPECGCGSSWVVKPTKDGFEVVLWLFQIRNPHQNP